MMPSGMGQELGQCQSAVLNPTPATSSHQWGFHGRRLDWGWSYFHSVTVIKCPDGSSLEEEVLMWLILQITAYHWGK